jgi:titin
LDETEPHKTRARVTQTTALTQIAEQHTSVIQKDDTPKRTTEETHEIITKFKSVPDSDEITQITTKKTIIKKRGKQTEEGDVIIEEVLNEIAPEEKVKASPNIEEVTEEWPEVVEIKPEVVDETETRTVRIKKKKKVTKEEEKVVEEEKPVIRELPEEVQVVEEETTGGQITKKIVKRRKIRKRRGSKQEDTEIVTVEEEGREPVTTVTIEEIEVPEEIEEIPEFVQPEAEQIEETPTETQIVKTTTQDGETKTKIVKRKVFKKRKGHKQENTEIVTVEEEGKEPQVTVSVEELPAVEEVKPEEPEFVEELPTEIHVTETPTEEGKIKKTVVKKIRRRRGGKEEQTEIVTEEEEGQAPTVVSIEETEVPVEEVEKRRKKVIKKVIKRRGGKEEVVTEVAEEEKPLEEIELQPEVLEVIELQPEAPKEEEKRRRKIVKKIKRRVGDKEEIVTEVVEEDKVEPLEQIELKPEEPKEEEVEETKVKGKRKIIKKIRKRIGDKGEIVTEVVEEDKLEPLEIIELQPEKVSTEVHVTESKTVDGKSKKVTVKKIRKHKGDKVEKTEIVTVEEQGKEPQVTVSVEEVDVPLEEVEELPEFKPERVSTQTEVVEDVTEEGKAVKTTIKKIKKRKGRKEEQTEIVTVEEEGKQPVVNVAVQEIEIPEEEIEEIPDFKPEQVTTETKVVETIGKRGKPKKTVIKTIRKRKGGKEEKTKIVTEEEEGEEPQTTVTVEEIPVEESIEEIPEFKPEKVSTETFVTESVNEKGKATKTIVKKIKKRKGGKEEQTQIVTVEEEGKKPVETVTVEEIPIEESVEEITELKPETVSTETHVTETISEEGKPTKKIVKKIKKRKGDKEERTEIVTVEEEGKEPATTVTVEEVSVPEEIEEVKPKKKVKKPKKPKEEQEQPENILFVPLIAQKKKEQEGDVLGMIQTELLIKALGHELPERKPQEETVETSVTESVTDEGKKKKTIIKKIKKRKGAKEEQTQIVTVEEEGKKPVETVTIEEIPIQEVIEEIPEFKPEAVSTETHVTESVTDEGKKKKTIIKKIKKRKGGKEEQTQIVTVEEEGKRPVETVTIEEIPIQEAIEEIPEFKPEAVSTETQVTESVTDEGKKKKTIIKKIKKRKGGKEEQTQIVTVEEEGKKPVETVTVEEIPIQEAIEEIPEFKPEAVSTETQVTESVTDEGKKKKTIIKKIKKRKGGKEEQTQIVTVEEEGKRPVETVTIEEIPIQEAIEEITEFKPKAVSTETQVTESVTDEGKKKKTIIKKIKKRKGGKEEQTQIVTVEEEGKRPVETVTIEEIPIQEAIEEIPEFKPEAVSTETQVTESVTDEGKKKKTIIKKIKKRKGGKEEQTQIVTVEEEGKKPVETVTIQEIPIQETIEEIPEFKPEPVSTETQVTESVTDEGKKKKIIIKKIKKRKGGKEEQTQIVTVEEEGKKPVETVTIEEIPIEEAIEEIPEFKPEAVSTETQVTESVTDEGKKKKTIIKKIKKRKGGKEEQTQIVTVEEEGKRPVETVTIEEIPIQEAIEEIPEFKPEAVSTETQVTESVTDEGKKKKTIIKKIKKRKGGKEEQTQIVTVEEEGKRPVETVTIEEIPIQEAIEEIPEFKPEAVSTETQVTESVTDEGKKKKTIIKKIKKRKGGKEEQTQIVTVEEEGKRPVQTVTIEEIPIQEAIEEIPEFKPEAVSTETQVTESVTDEGKKKKTIIKKIKKRKGGKEEQTQIVTVEEEGKRPVETVTIEEIPIQEAIEEIPEFKPEAVSTETQVTESVTDEGKKKKTIIKKIKKRKGGKEEQTQIVTVEEEGKRPVETVTIEEIPIQEAIEEIPEFKPEAVSTETQVTESVTDEGKKKKTIIKKIKKRKGGKEEQTQIVTVEEEGKRPVETVTIEEIPIQEAIEEIPEFKPEAVSTETQVTESVTDEGKKKKTIIKKIKKRKGGKEEQTQIVTVEEEGKRPVETVTIEEIPIQEAIEEIPEFKPEAVSTETQVTESVTDEGKKKKTIIKKIKKRKGGKEEQTQIVTVEEEGKRPVETVTIEEIPIQEAIEEIPEFKPEAVSTETQVTESVTDEGKKKKTIIKKIKKRKGGKEEQTQIVTVEEEGKRPVETVTIEEIPIQEAIEELPEFKPEAVSTETQVTESVTDEGKKKKTIIKKIKTRKGDKEEQTQIVTVEEEGKKPVETVTFEEIPLEEPTEQTIEFKPEAVSTETQVTESVTDEGKKKKTIIKKIKKRRGGKEEQTQIVTVEEEGKRPVETVTIEEIPIEESVEEIPELMPETVSTETHVTETISEEGKPTKKIVKKIKKRKGDKEERTEIVTVEEQGKEPTTTVTVEEVNVPEEVKPEPKEPKKKVKKPKKPKEEQEQPENILFVPLIAQKKKEQEGDVLGMIQTELLKKVLGHELPERKPEQESVETSVTESITDEGKRKKTIIKKIKKRKGAKEEQTQIVTVEEEGKKPVETVTIEEIPVQEPTEEITELKPESVSTETHVTETITDKGKPKKTTIKKIKKRKGGKEEQTEIVTVEEEGKKPFVTVTVEETPVEETTMEIPEFKPEKVSTETFVTEGVTEEGKSTKTIVKKIKKRKAGKEERTEIVTIEEEGQEPQTTVSVEEVEVPEQLEEIPDFKPETVSTETKVSESVTEEGKVQKTIVKKIKKRKGGKEEQTKIITVEEEGKKPTTTVTIEEVEVPEEVQELPEFKPESVSTETHVTETISEEGKPTKTTVKKIRKRKGGKEEKTEIVTVEEEGKEPKTTVAVEEIDVPEIVEETPKEPKKKVKKVKKPKEQEEPEKVLFVPTLAEKEDEPEGDVIEMIQTELLKKALEHKLPELKSAEESTETYVTETVTDTGKAVKTTVKKVKKRKGAKEKITEVVTVEEEGEAPKTTLTVEEIPVEEPVEEIPEFEVEKVSTETEVVQTVTAEGKPTKTVVKKIKKRKGGKEEQTKIVTVEEEGKPSKTTVSVEEFEVPEELPEIKPQKADYVEDLPAEVQVIETISVTGKPKKTTIRKMKRRKGDKEERTQIVTVEEVDQKPVTTVSIEEIQAPEELEEIPAVKLEEPRYVEELPVEIQVTETVTPEGKPTRKIVKKIKRRKEGKIEETKVTRVEEEGKKPEITVLVEEIEMPEKLGEIPEFKPETVSTEIHVVETVTKEGKPKRTITKKIKKRKDGKEVKTETVTVEEEGKKPKTTVIVEDFETAEELEVEKIEPEKVDHVIELPAEIQVTETVTKEGKPKKTTVKKIRRRKGGKVEKTEIVTVEEEGKKPKTTVSVEEVPEEVEEIPEIKPEEPDYTEKLPVEIQVSETITKEGKPRKTTIKKIRRRKGDKEEKTEVVTVEEEGKKPKTTVSVEEFEIPEELQPEKVSTEIQVIETIDKTGKPEKTTIKKIRKRRGSKVEKTEIVTVEEVGKKPKTTVSIEEIEVPEELEEIPAVKYETPDYVEELPAEVEVTEAITKEGKRQKTIVRKIKKRKGQKEEKTSIVTVEEEGKPSETTITVEEVPAIVEKKKPKKPIEELPVEVTVTETVSIEGKPKKTIVKKLKRRAGNKEETTKIVTVEEEGKKPTTTVTVEEIIIPEEVEPLPEKPVLIEELPTEVKVTEIVGKDGKPTRKVVKVRRLRKRKGSKQEDTQIVTVEEEGKKPTTTVTVEETEIPELVQEIPEIKPEEAVYLEELPEEVQVTETVTKEGKPKRKIVKTRKIRKRKGSKQENTEIVTVEEEGKKPQYTVCIEEIDVPEEVQEIAELLPQEATYIEELPTEVKVTETVTKEGKPKRKTVKIRKIRKRRGSKQEDTQIVTVEEEGKPTETTVTVEEIEVPEEITEEPLKPLESVFIEELPQEVQIVETTTPDGKIKKQKIKTRVIRKQKGDKEEKTQIVTVEEEGKEPKTTVTVEETEAAVEPKKKKVKKVKKPKEEEPKEKILFVPTLAEKKEEPEGDVLDMIKSELIKKALAHQLPELPEGEIIEVPEFSTLEELPEEVIQVEEVDKKGIPVQKTVKKRTIKKKKGDKLEITKILTTETEGEKPEIVVTTEEVDKDDETYQEPGVSITELPEDVEVIEISTTDKVPKKKITKKKTLLKKVGPKIEATEIVTVLEDDKEPEQTVTVKEYPPKEKKVKKVKKEKPKADDKGTREKPVPMKLEIIKMEPTKVKVVTKEEIPLLSQLKKPKAPPKRAPKTAKFPKVRLTSRIVRVTFPPEGQEEQKPVITQRKRDLKDHGELSRNVKDAEEVLKKKRFKVKDIEQFIPDLETPEDTELPEKPKSKKDKPKDKYERKPKPAPEEEEKPDKLKIGKGKVPVDDNEIETVKLKKVPEKPGEEVPDKPKKAKPEPKPEQKIKPEKPEADDEGIKFKPYDIDAPEIELEKPTKVEDEKEEEDKEKKKGKYKPKKKEKPKPEEEEIKLIKGKPKEKPEEEEKDIKLKYKQKPKPEEEPETIKLKPWKKDSKDEVTPVKLSDKIKFQVPKVSYVEEVPEKEEVIEEIVDKKPKKKRVKTRVLKRNLGDKQEITEIITVQEEDKKPEVTIITTVEPLEEESVEPVKTEERVIPIIIIELPEEVKVSEVKTEKGKSVKKVIKKRIIKKRVGPIEEIINIETEEIEGEEPKTTVTVQEVLTEELPEFTEGVIIEELPEKVEEIEEVIRGKIKKRKIRKRVFKKDEDGQKELTEIVSVEEEDEKPEITATTVVPDSSSTVTVEFPEETEITEERRKKKIKKRRVIKKQMGPMQEITKIETEEIEGEEPESTVTIEEIIADEIPEIAEAQPVEELPEKEVTIEEEVRGVIKRKKIKRRVVKKDVDGKQEITEIVTTEEDDKQPQVSVTTVVHDIASTEPLKEETTKPLEPAKRKPKKVTPTIVELPEEVTVTEIKSKKGPSKTVTKKVRTIKKQVGPIQEITRIETAEEEGKEPETTVTVEEIIADEIPEIAEAKPVEELPEKVEVVEEVVRGKVVRKKIKKKVIKKENEDGQQEITQIVTTEEEGKKLEVVVTTIIPDTSFVEPLKQESVSQFEPEKKPKKKVKPTIVELPEEVKVTEVVTKKGPTKKVTKTRVIKKQVGPIQEITRIETTEEEGEEPETTVTVEEVISDDLPEIIEAQPIEEQEKVEVVREKVGDKIKTKKIKKRTIKKIVDGKPEVTEIVTIQEDDKKPKTVVTKLHDVSIIEEEAAKPFEPEKKKPKQTKPVIVELPEEVTVTEVKTKKGPVKKVVKTRKIKKQVDGVQEITTIQTAEEEGKEPETTVTIEEIIADEPLALEEAKPVEELPEKVDVIEEVVRGKVKTKKIKRRVLKSDKDGKQEITEIVTVEEDDKAPQTTVTTLIHDTSMVQPLEEEITEPHEPKQKKPKKIKPTVVEMPEVKVTEVTTKEGKPVKKTVTKKVIKKQIGPIQEITKIETKQEEGEEPEVTVTVEEIIADEPTVTEELQPVTELPEKVDVVEEIVKGVVKTKKIKKRVIKKEEDGKQEITEIVTVEEDDKKPQVTVTTMVHDTSTVQPLEEEIIEPHEPEKKKPKKIKQSVVELPEVQVTEVVTKKGKPVKKTVTTKVIKKQTGPIQEITRIETAEEEGEEPQTTVTIEEIIADEPLPIEEAKPVQEFPEKVDVIQEVVDGQIKKKKIKRRVIKKEKDGKQEITEIVTVEEDDKKPQISVTTLIHDTSTVQPLEEETAEPQEPEKKKPKKITPTVVELPEVEVTEVTTKEGKPAKKKITKKVIKKQIGPIQEITRIETAEEEGEEPQTTVTIEEIIADEPLPIEEAKPVQEFPEKVDVIEEVVDGQIKKKKIKRRVIKKEKDGKQEITEIVTVEEDDKKPQISVTTLIHDTSTVQPLEEETTEPQEPEKKKPKKIKPSVVELPEVEVTEVTTKEGKPIKKTVTKKVIKKQIGPIQEITRIETAEEEGEEPQTTVTIEEIIADEPLPIEEAKPVQEFPEKVDVIEEVVDGQIKKKKIKRRVIKKEKDGKQEITEIVTVEEDDKKPQISVTTLIHDTSTVQPLEEETTEPQEPEKKKPKKITPTVVELPEVEVTEVTTKEGKPAKKKITKKVIKKQIGPIQEITRIETAEEEGEEPQTTVTIEEIIADEPLPIEEAKPVQEFPEKVDVIEEVVGGQIKRKKIKKRVLKKEEDGKQQITEIVTIEEDDKEPQTTVTTLIHDASSVEPLEEEVSEPLKPEKIKPKKIKPTIVELPEEVKITEVETEEGLPAKRKVTKKVIKKQIGPIQEVTKIETAEEEGKEPETTVTVEEFIAEELPEEAEATVIEELPEKVDVIEEVVGGKIQKKKIKKRVVKKDKDGKQEITEIVTIEEEDKKPKTTVTTLIHDISSEGPLEQESFFSFELEKGKPKKIKPTVVELPEEVKVTEVITKEGPVQRVTKKRVIKKQIGPIQEITKIETAKEEGKEPEITVTVEEVIADEIPEVIEVQPIQEEEKVEVVEEKVGDKVKVKKIKKRTITKEVDGKPEITEITTVQEDDKKPKTTIKTKLHEVSSAEPLEEIVKPFEPEKKKKKKVQPTIVELPEEVKVTEVITEKGPTEKVTTKRVIKKQVGPIQEITKIETTEEEDKPTETTVTIEEIVSDVIPEIAESKPVEELEKVDVEEKIVDGKTKKVKTKKRVIKKDVKDGKQQITEIVTIEEDDKEPQTTVTTILHDTSTIEPMVEEMLKPYEPDQKKPKKIKPTIVEYPEEVTVTEVTTKQGEPSKKVTRKKVIKKQTGPVEEITHIETTQEGDEEPQTTITIVEMVPDELPKFIELKPAEELPEKVEVTEELVDGKIKKKKVKKQITKREKDGEAQITEIITVQEDDKLPKVTVNIYTSDNNFTEPLKLETVTDFDQTPGIPQRITPRLTPHTTTKTITEVHTLEHTTETPLGKKYILYYQHFQYLISQYFRNMSNKYITLR